MKPIAACLPSAQGRKHKESMKRIRIILGALALAITVAILAGIVYEVRLMLRSSGRVRDAPRGMTQDQALYLQFLSNQPKSFVASGSEACNWEESAAEARVAGNLGDPPLIVLTAGQGFVPEDPTAAREAAAFHEVWVHELQPQLARLSTRGRQVIVESSGHGMQYEAPDAVIGAVHEVVIQIRREQRK
jgi:hypothetical protein